MGRRSIAGETASETRAANKKQEVNTILTNKLFTSFVPTYWGKVFYERRQSLCSQVLLLPRRPFTQSNGRTHETNPEWKPVIAQGPKSTVG